MSIAAVPAIPGSTELPSGYPHPHASEEARAIAERGMILRVQVGSGVHGTSITGQDDRDEMGLCLEPPQFVTGLAKVPNGTVGENPTVRFEQYERHTAWDRPGGLANRSGAGDLDVIVYSARKWARLALAGNPTVLLVLFVPDEEVVYRDAAGAELVANAHRFVSRLAAVRFLGYLRGQQAAMTGQSGAHTNRPELVAVHGYDTKYAMHALRLGLQGVELLTTGRITLPVPQPHRGYLRSVRRGERSLAEVLDAIADAEARLVALRDGSAVPDQPDRAWVDAWLHRSYLDFWSRTGQLAGLKGSRAGRPGSAVSHGGTRRASQQSFGGSSSIHELLDVTIGAAGRPQGRARVASPQPWSIIAGSRSGFSSLVAREMTSSVPRARQGRPDRAEQRLDRVDPHHQVEPAGPRGGQVKQVGGHVTDRRPWVLPDGPLDRGRRDIEAGDRVAQARQELRVVAEAAADDKGALAPAVEALARRPLGQVRVGAAAHGTTASPASASAYSRSNQPLSSPATAASAASALARALSLRSSSIPTICDSTRASRADGSAASRKRIVRNRG